MILILFIFLFSFSFTKIIDHQIPSNIYSKSPLNIKVYTDYNPIDIIQFNLYYRSGSSGPYMMGKFLPLSDDYYSYTIPAEFFDSKYIEYYILLETSNGEYKSIPENDPHDVPISLRVSKLTSINSIDFDDETGLKSDVNIIAPQPNQNILLDDLFIALSYFRIPDVDTQLTQIFIDDIDMSNSANINKSSLTLSPNSLKPGDHTIKVIIIDKNGNKYNPVKWNFYIIGKTKRKISNTSFSGKLWNDFLDNKVDAENTYTNNTNLDLKFESDWVNFKTKLKKSSLENEFSQAKDRYSFNFDLNKLKIQYGDFYPNLNNFIISGNRVRGIGLKYNTKFFQLDLLTGEIARAVQGDPNDKAVVISDYSSEYICTEYDVQDVENCIDGSDVKSLDVSRSNYTFKRDISALKMNFGRKDRWNWGYFILKVKDDINSVNKSVPNAIVSLSNDLEIFQNFNSDQFIDVNQNGEWDENIDELFEDGDLNDNGIFDDSYTNEDEIFDNLLKIANCTADINSNGICENDEEGCNCEYDISNIYSYDILKIESTTLYCLEYDLVTPELCIEEESRPLIQWVWDIKVNNNNLEEYLIDNYTADLDKINYLDDQWASEKPKDNFILGSESSYISKGKKVKIRHSRAISFLNENIWNPVKKVDDFDTYSDEFEDCEFGTTYDLDEDNDGIDEYIASDLVWEECGALPTYQGSPVNLQVENQGIALSDLPDPESFEDVFHYNFDSVPTIPFYSIIQQIQSSGSCNLGVCNVPDGEDDPGYIAENLCGYSWSALDDQSLCEENGGEWLSQNYTPSIDDIINSPEVAYDLDFSLKVLNSEIKFGAKKVGQSFNTLGNPYLQKDIKEKYLSNRLRVLDNRMFLGFKYSIIKNGISEESNLDKSNKFDVNISYYPGIDLPTFNFSLGSYKRKSGEKSLGYTDINGNNIGAFDSRVDTETNNYNFSVNHSFDYMYKHNATFTYYYSSKKDNLLDEKKLDESYISPRSMNRSLGINVKTTYNAKWEGNFNYSNSSFDYAQSTSSFYEQQQINSLSGLFNYHMNKKIDKIGGGIDYVNGSGSSRYNQFSIRMYSEFALLENLNLNVRYNYRIKKIKSSDDYYNSLFKVNLSYRF